MKSCFITILLILLIAINLAFIWCNSLLDQTQSGQVSSEVTEVIRPILEPIIGEDNYSGGIVRKLAHFVEFGVLGGLLSLLMNRLHLTRGLSRLLLLPYLLTSGLLAAMIDETIQIYTNRGSQVLDVWLDSSGVAVGFAVTHAVTMAILVIIKKRKASISHSHYNKNEDK